MSMQVEAQEAMREAFEAWYATPRSPEQTAELEASPYYHQPQKMAAWEAWCAALSLNPPLSLDAGNSKIQGDPAQAINEGIERAAKWIEQRLNDYDSEHGSTDPDTGTREYPGRGAGEEYVQELHEIIEGIRALAAPSGSSATGESNDDESNSGRARRLAGEGDDDQSRSGREADGHGVIDDGAAEREAGLLRAQPRGDSRQGDAEPVAHTRPQPSIDKPAEQSAEELTLIGFTHAYDLEFPFAYASLGPENSERNIPVFVKTAAMKATP